MTDIASFTFKLVLKILLVGIRIQLVVLFDGLKSFNIIQFKLSFVQHQTITDSNKKNGATVKMSYIDVGDGCW